MTEVVLASILPRRARAKADEFQVLTERFIARVAKYLPCSAQISESESALFASAARQPGRAAAHVILFDSRGKLLTSEEFAALLGKVRDEGAQRIIFAIGPPDGWSEEARGRASALVSFGRITLPHELARVVAAEQIYRALTILAGHPYHCGH